MVQHLVGCNVGLRCGFDGSAQAVGVKPTCPAFFVYPEASL